MKCIEPVEGLSSACVEPVAVTMGHVGAEVGKDLLKLGPYWMSVHLTAFKGYGQGEPTPERGWIRCLLTPPAGTIAQW